MKVLKRSEFVEQVKALKGGTYVGLDIETDPKALKKDRFTGEPNPYSTITKLGSLSGNLGSDYGRRVQKHLDASGIEEAVEVQPRAWGTLLPNRMLVEHKGKYYLQIIPDSATKPIYIADGRVVEHADLIDLLPLDRGETSSTQASLGEDAKVIVRDIKIDSIKRIRWFGEEFELVD